MPNAAIHVGTLFADQKGGGVRALLNYFPEEVV